MSSVAHFIFNPFQENSYIIYDDSKECILVDPGCHSPEEQDELKRFIEQSSLNPVKLINTHCHVDHVFGNHFVAATYGLKLEMHESDLVLLHKAPETAKSYGITIDPSPEPENLLKEGDTITFGETELEVLHTPGHSPGSISLFSAGDDYVIVGDVLFLNSIGRYDFPLSNYDDLMHSITEKLYKLGDDVTVYSGHGPETTIGYERESNPFVREHLKGMN